MSCPRSISVPSSGVTRLFLLALMMTALIGPWAADSVLAACDITGVVYRDYNASGTRDSLLEPGAGGITVTAYAPDGSVITSTITAADGTYTVNVPDGDVRIEFTALPDYLRPGPYGDGNQSTTTVAFVNCAGTAVSGINLAVNNPGDFCHSPNPLMATSCYTKGYQLNKSEPAVVAFDYNASGDDADADTPGVQLHPVLALASEVGTTWGMAYQRTSDSLFVGAFTKRHTGFGPDASGTAPTTGGIYWIPNVSDVSSGGVAQLLIDLNAVFGTGMNPHPDTAAAPDVDWRYDLNSWDSPGKIGLGDIDISDDGQILYTINLFTRQLYRIPVGAPPTVPVPPGSITTYDLPDPGTGASGCPFDPATPAGELNLNLRPFATGFNDGRLFIGMVCTAESTQNPADLRAFVYQFDPGTAVFTQVLNFPLDYPRRCVNRSYLANCDTIHPAEWRPWSPVFGGDLSGPENAMSKPQPWLTDIEFDGSDMILGFRDRMGDQGGSGSYNLNPPDMTLYVAVSAGDMLRACYNPTTNQWVLESNGTCGGRAASVNMNGQGPGGPQFREFYWQDYLPFLHDELSLGGLAQVPGQPDTMVTVFDPLFDNTQLHDAGVRRLSSTNGAMTQAYRVYDGEPGWIGPTFGKANGIGDVEAFCGPAPLEIGNRVWLDANQNGIQDAGEVPLVGVTVNLYSATGVLLATAITNASGEYYFRGLREGETSGTLPAHVGEVTGFLDINGNGLRGLNEPRGVMPRTGYLIRLDNPADYAAGPLVGLELTFANTSADLRDSDAAPVGGFPEINIVTGDFGENDHTYDFGFFQRPPATPTATASLTVTPTSIISLTPSASVPATPPSGGALSPTPTETPAPSINVVKMNISKRSDPPFAQPGETVVWLITVTNTGLVAATNVVVEDVVPDDLAIASAVATAGSVTISGQRVTLTLATLGPGEVVTLTITTQVRDDVIVPFILSNGATVSSAELAQPQSSQAIIVSVGELPRTGERPLWALLLVGLAVGLVGAAVTMSVYAMRRR